MLFGFSIDMFMMLFYMTASITVLPFMTAVFSPFFFVFVEMKAQQITFLKVIFFKIIRYLFLLYYEAKRKSTEIQI